MKKLLILLFLSLFLISACNIPKEIKGCTAEGKVCPDGSVVGRAGPNCEFAPCPIRNNFTIVANYTIDTNCNSDEDCGIINKDLGLSCCYAGACDIVDYSKDNYVAVNSLSYEILRDLKCPLKEDCGPAPFCPTQIINENSYGKCVNNICEKSIGIRPAEPNENSEITQGAKGQVLYGEGDCMPPINENNRLYTKFNGDLYFMNKKEFDLCSKSDVECSGNRGIKTIVKEGFYEINLEPGTYIVMPKEVYSYYTNVTILNNKVTQKDFKFFKCLSY